MAKTNPVKTITFTGHPYEEFEDQSFFLVEETKDGVIVNSQPDGKGFGIFLSHKSEGWEFDGDYTPDIDVTYDRQTILEYLVNDVEEWPSTNDVIYGQIRNIRGDWYWKHNPPAEYLIAYNTVTGEQISRSDWRAELHETENCLTYGRPEMLNWLSENIDTWPKIGDDWRELNTPQPWTWVANLPNEQLIVVNPNTQDVLNVTAYNEYMDAKHDTYDSDIKEAEAFDAHDLLPGVPGYEKLRSVLDEAYDQASRGKGKERHALDLPFHEQRMQTISRLLRSERGMAYQACKKVVEGLDLQTHEARRRELLGAINYIAGILVYWDEAEIGDSDV